MITLHVLDDNGVYQYTSEFDEFLPAPRHATIAPPVINDGEFAVFNSGSWSVSSVYPSTYFKSPEETRAKLKAERDAKVAAIVVTTATGKQFNGDETSQTRMARAIVAMQDTNAQTITWVLATNDAVEVSLAELSEALALAGQAQAAVWVLPE